MAAQSQDGWGSGKPLEEEALGAEKHFRIWDGVVAEVGAGEVEEAATPKMLQAPGHCHLTQAGLFSRAPPHLHCTALHPGCQATSTLPPSHLPPPAPTPPTLQTRRPTHLPDPLLHHATARPWHSTTALLTQGLQSPNTRVQTPAQPRSDRNADKFLLLLRLKLQLTLPSTRPTRKRHTGAGRRQRGQSFPNSKESPGGGNRDSKTGRRALFRHFLAV